MSSTAIVQARKPEAARWEFEVIRDNCLPSDRESDYAASGLLPRGVHPINTRPWRSVLEPAQKLIDPIAWPFRNNFHGPVGTVADRAEEVEPIGLAFRISPEEHSLDPAPDDGVKAHTLSSSSIETGCSFGDRCRLRVVTCSSRNRQTDGVD